MMDIKDFPIFSHPNKKFQPETSKVGYKNVYIWDMDETLILLKSLLDGTYAAAFNDTKDLRKGIEIGKCWENHILEVCDSLFFYEQIDNYNEPFLASLSEYDDGRELADYDFNDNLSFPCDDSNRRKLAYRHRIIAQKYKQGLHNFINKELIKQWNDLYESTDSYTDKWLSSGHALLEQALSNTKPSSHHSCLSENAVPAIIDTKCQNINVLVTSGSLIPSLAKCLLFRLDDVITEDNVYSSWDVGKLQCFSWIKERYGGQGVRFCAIGDGIEECEAAQKMKWPFIKINMRPGDPYRFPGISLSMIETYMELIYGPSNSFHGDEESGCN